MTELIFSSMPELIHGVLGDDRLIRAVFSGPPNGSPWRRLIVRRITLRGEPHLQFNWHTAKNCDTRNYGSADSKPLDKIVAAGFRHAHVESADETIDARTSKRGRLLTSRQAVTNRSAAHHDQPRSRLAPESAPFLEVVGMSVGGRVKPSSQRKFRQINEFLRIVDSTLRVSGTQAAHTFRVVDFGCGNAYLTFAVYHLLTEVKGLRCSVIGVDRSIDAVMRNNERSAALGWTEGLRFVGVAIEEYPLEHGVDLVLSLHSCDTATDAALAAGVRSGSRFILASPCCHHHLQQQMKVDNVPSGFREVMRDGVLREQLGDVITDALRAARLRMAGYAVDVMAFVPLENTTRNVLIRAVRQPGLRAASSARNYGDLTDSFNLRPRIGALLDGAPVIEDVNDSTN